MAFISWKRLLPAAWDFCTAFRESPDHISAHEFVKRLDLTPHVPSSFASSPNGSVPSRMKASYRLPVGVRVGDLEKGSRAKTSSSLEAFQMQWAIIIITTSTATICWAPIIHTRHGAKRCVDITSSNLTSILWSQYYYYPCVLSEETEAQRSKEICTRSHSCQGQTQSKNLELTSKNSCFRAFGPVSPRDVLQALRRLKSPELQSVIISEGSLLSLTGFCPFLSLLLVKETSLLEWNRDSYSFFSSSPLKNETKPLLMR